MKCEPILWNRLCLRAHIHSSGYQPFLLFWTWKFYDIESIVCWTGSTVHMLPLCFPHKSPPQHLTVNSECVSAHSNTSSAHFIGTLFNTRNLLETFTWDTSWLLSPHVSFFIWRICVVCITNACKVPTSQLFCPLWCSPQAVQVAVVSSESPETQEEREKAWMRGGRQPEMLHFGLFWIQIQESPGPPSPGSISGQVMLLLSLTMVGELAAPLPGTARGLTVRPSQDKLLKRQELVVFHISPHLCSLEFNM